MKKIRIVIADTNTQYMDSLAAFMRSSEEASKFILTFFSNVEHLSTYINQGENIDILLISPELYDEDLTIDNQTTLILLEDDQFSNRADELKVVYRYQRLNQLVSNILSIYYEQNITANKLLARSKETNVISVYSPVGGTGKTTVATNLSKQLALTGAKVFYLNLETFNSTKLYFTSKEDNPSLQIFYYVKTDLTQLSSKIEALKKYDPYSMIDYFDLAVSADEMLEITGSEVQMLLNGIIETGSYDYIVVDLDSSLHERNKSVLIESDQIIWPIKNDAQSFFKSNSFLKEEEKIIGKENIIKDKMLVIVNGYDGSLNNHVDDLEFSINGYLPYIREWSLEQSAPKLLNNDVFNQEVQAIIFNHVINKKGGVTSDE